MSSASDLPVAAARRLDQRLNARNVAQPEPDESQGQEILRIGRIELEGLLEQIKRRLRVLREREGALMAKRGGGLRGRTLGLGALFPRNFGEEPDGGRAVPGFELGDGAPRGPRVLGIEREHGFRDQRPDAVALLQREAVALLLRAAGHLAGNKVGDLLGRQPNFRSVLAQRPVGQERP